MPKRQTSAQQRAREAARTGEKYTAALRAETGTDEPVRWLGTRAHRVGNMDGDLARDVLILKDHRGQPLWLSRGRDHGTDQYRIIQEHDGWHGYVRGSASNQARIRSERQQRWGRPRPKAA